MGSVLLCEIIFLVFLFYSWGIGIRWKRVMNVWIFIYSLGRYGDLGIWVLGGAIWEYRL